MNTRLRSGPLLMALAALVFTVMVGLVKVVRAELEASEIIFWRGLVGVPIALLATRGAALRPRSPALLAGRLLLGFGAMVCFFTAAKGLPLAENSLITKVQPLLVAILAPLALGATERPEPRVWGALLLGLLGCALLLSAGLDAGGPWALWALAAAAFSAGAHTCLRALGRTDIPAVIVLWFQVAIIPMALGLHLLGHGNLPSLPSPSLWLPIAGIGAGAVLGQNLMTHAYQRDRAAVVAAASYTAPLWAGIGDLLWWHHLPSWSTVIGGGIIITAGLIVSTTGKGVRRAPSQVR
ncbi:MAG: DMT family transporter [Oligoflexia bacterium]|nr:DMT family transporter [Oligoflexia bacterium]